ncbi:hypothetical protein D918_03050 [Trichuris suis]|nr:hypothetical protein D918_03050 [Trichuris suis]
METIEQHHGGLLQRPCKKACEAMEFRQCTAERALSKSCLYLVELMKLIAKVRVHSECAQPLHNTDRSKYSLYLCGMKIQTPPSETSQENTSFT